MQEILDVWRGTRRKTALNEALNVSTGDSVAFKLLE